jgi:hypothetical protein
LHTLKNIPGYDEFGYPFPPYLARGDERRHRSRWRGVRRHNSIINFEQVKNL